MPKKKRKPHHFKKRKPIYRSRFFWLALLVLVFSFGLVYFLFFSDFFQIKTIEISGLERVEKEEIELIFEKKLENKFLFFSSKSIFLFNSNKTKKMILEEFSQLAEVEIRRSLPDSLSVSIKERKELAKFCFFKEEEEQKNCFALDKEGILFETKKEAELLVNITDKTDFNGLRPGSRALEPKKLNLILEINYQLEEILNIPLKEFVIYPGKLATLTREGWQAYFDLEGNISWQITKLKVLLEERITQEQRANLEYIELRFGNFANPKYIEQ